MTIMMDDYPQLLRQIEKVKENIQEKHGEIRQVKKRLKSEFGCKTVKEAKRLHAKLLKNQIATADKYVRLKKEFEKKWQKLLSKIK